jgi:glycosyltransferase involved in cell wall biosynthesis
MHIIFTRFPLESRFGGAEVQTISLMKGLREKGHEVSFLGSCPTLLVELPKHGIAVQKLDIGNPPVTKFGAISFFWRRFGMKRKLIRAVSSFDGTIFMLSLTEKLLLTDYAVQKNIKVFWVEHDKVDRWLTVNPWLPHLLRLSRQVTTITVSDLSREIYRKLGWSSEHVISIPDGIDVKKFVQKEKKTYPDDVFRCGCIARLTRDKGVDVLLKAIASFSDIHLTIIGEGPEEKTLRAYTQEHHLDSRVTFTSDVPLDELYKDLDVLILPSREHDPFGMVVAEAMAHGIPTICTTQCGIAGYLQPGEALTVRANDAEALRDALTTVQEQEIWEALAENGPRIATERFSSYAMVDTYVALLQNKKT